MHLSRRAVTYGVAACALVATQRRMEAGPDQWHSILAPPPPASFAELQKWLAGLPNRQSLGSSTFRCKETGEPYVEIFVRASARPADVAVIEANVAADMQRAICDLFTDRIKGAIFWRIPLETEIMNDSVVIEYREDGPDREVYTDRRCVMDKNWRSVKAYARLTVAPFK